MQDERLLVVAREYVAHRKPLPGVRSSDEAYPWPWTPHNRFGITGNSKSGGGYVSSRRLLLNRYAVPWLRALHQMDHTAYAAMVFDHCSQSALAKRSVLDDIFNNGLGVHQVTCQRRTISFSGLN